MHCELVLSYNRATLLSRSLYCYLNQDIEENTLLLIFNTGKPLELGHFDMPQNRQIFLINSQEDYKSVGAKYNKALIYLPPEITSICLKDDDDVSLPGYHRLGVEGLRKSGKKAYKPERSYFHSNNQVSLQSNVFEGSIFMKADHLRKHGFHEEFSVKYHDKWLLPLIEEQEIFVDSDGCPQWIYDWGTPVPCYKMSGRLESPENYETSKIEAKDYGNGILIPSNKHLINVI